MPDPQTWNRKAMLLVLRGDETQLAEVVRIFLEEAPRALASLRDAAEQGDTSTIERISHTLKGDLAYMALPELGKIAAEVEQLSRQGNLDQARPLAKALERAIEQVCVTVKRSAGAEATKSRAAVAGPNS
jgi:two-component system sensor histidine kinase/response regulator